MTCPHQKISLGLDAAYCPDCKCEFRPWTAEYKQALERSPAASSNAPGCASSPVASSSNAPLEVGDRVFHVTWNVVGIIHAPISPNWEVKFANGIFICAPDELNYTCSQVGKQTSIHADKQALVTEVSGVNKDSSGGCEHDWTILWTEDLELLELVDYCLNCHRSQPTRDRAILERYQSSALEVIAEYKFALSKNPRSRKQFEVAIAEKKQQLRYLEQRIAVLSVEPETVSNDPGDPENPVLTVEPETVSNDPGDPENPVLTVEPETVSNDPGDPENPVLTVEPENKRKRGEGTGRIQWRIFKKGEREYKQAWYDWQLHQGGKTFYRSKYIPKRLVAKIQELEKEKVPVREILKVLGKVLGGGQH